MMKTLIVEDSAGFRKTFKEALGKRFPVLTIEEAADGKEAMQRIETWLPDMVFMDIRLPGETGLELTKKIKQLTRVELTILCPRVL
jgi:CheY-like chemotaxis protein